MCSIFRSARCARCLPNGEGAAHLRSDSHCAGSGAGTKPVGLVRTALEAQGWGTFEAGSIRNGLVEARTQNPDLIILDLGLPDGDGMDFLAELRSWSKVPVIILSARASEQWKIRALDGGADDYLTKPFGVGELLARVRATSRRDARVDVLEKAGCLTHRQILNAVWGAAHSQDGHYVRIYMSRLRQKLESDPARPQHILTETGVGYRLVQNPTGRVVNSD